jgi:hypothetical protein
MAAARIDSNLRRMTTTHRRELPAMPDLRTNGPRGLDDRTFLERLHRSSDDRVRPPLTIARNVAAVAVAVGVLAQVVLWAVLGVAAGEVGFPWWIWASAGGAILVTALSVLARRSAPQQPRARVSGGEAMAAPSSAPRPGRRDLLSWRTANRVMVPLFVVATLAQLTVWLVQGYTGTFDSPWWAWSALPHGGLTLVVAVLARNEARQSNA